MRSAATAVVALAVLALAPSAHGHALVRMEGTTLTYTATDVSDASALNTVTVTAPSADALRIADPTVSGGMDPGPCVPITENEVECPRSGVALVRVDVGLGDDSVAISAPLPGQLIGGDGKDTITGGPGAELIVGGTGADSIDAGAGDDDIRTRDGEADSVACGDGSDSLTADNLDLIPDAELPRCERLDRGGAGTGVDNRSPTVATSGLSIQRVARRRRVRVVATVDEAARLTASGVLLVPGRRRPIRLRDASGQIDVAGGGIEMAFRLPRSGLAAVRRASRRRPVVARILVVATDADGNRSRAQTLRIRLRR